MSKSVVTKPSKSRKNRFRAPQHVKHKFLSATLSPPLRTQHGVRSMPVRKEDTVTITKGDRKMTEGRITRVDVAKGRLFIEGVNRQRQDGTTVQVPISPQNVMITKLSLDDWRRRILERRGFKATQGKG